MEINLLKFLGKEAYFEIITNEIYCSTSREISNVFNMNIDDYNEILINEVIKHDRYRPCDIADEFNLRKDLIFKLNNTPEEVYINRFKEVFINQLTSLALGGVNNVGN